MPTKLHCYPSKTVEVAGSENLLTLDITTIWLILFTLPLQTWQGYHNKNKVKYIVQTKNMKMDFKLLDMQIILALWHFLGKALIPG